MRRVAPATARNRTFILDVLKRYVSAGQSVLEIASGSGEHALFLAPALGVASWQPSDLDPEARASIDAYRATASDAVSAIVRPAITIDVTTKDAWPAPDVAPQAVDAIVCINMIHISPWGACLGLLDHASRILSSSTGGSRGVLYLYGPYRRGGKHTAPSNEAFDESLQSRNPEWGVRNLDDVVAEAARRDFDLAEVAPMPANNLSVVFVKSAKKTKKQG